MQFSELFIKLRKRLSGRYAGQFRSTLQWSGIIIADSRKYVAGDSKKFINWKQSAKHNDLYVSLLEQDSDVQVDVFCDVNYNWQWAIDYPNGDKVFAYLADLVLFAHGKGMGLSVYYPHEGLRCTKVSRIDDRYQVQESLSAVIRHQIPRYKTDVSWFLHAMVQTKKKRVILIISDFLAVSDDDVRHIARLQKDHQVLCVRVGVDQLEGVNYIGMDTKKLGIEVYDL